jgi:hypothetical protein
MDESKGAGRGSRPRRGGSASAGVPETGTDMRVSDLERRLAQLEGEPSLRDRSRKMMDRVLPPEATRHFRNAGREQLLGIRSIVDHWINRIDNAENRASDAPGRERIEID